MQIFHPVTRTREQHARPATERQSRSSCAQAQISLPGSKGPARRDRPSRVVSRFTHAHSYLGCRYVNFKGYHPERLCRGVSLSLVVWFHMPGPVEIVALFADGDYD
ncbi:hypothetical protein BaRGS_00030649 [Batillaria attramentaria]|uniref:Uncharacterized protein n=1 Tax=Batillaria attramentaria TaxID=370345 RepID=A0ABD0JSW9_9CAEN